MIASQPQTLLPQAGKSWKQRAILWAMWTAWILITASVVENLPAQSPGNNELRSRQITVRHARPVRNRAKAEPRVVTAPQLSEHPAERAIQQAGFVEITQTGCDGSCGAACDCIGATCGVEGPIMPMADPTCGSETWIDGGACGCSQCSPMGCDTNACDSGMCGGCDSCSDDFLSFNVPAIHIAWQRMELFAGVQGFKGPMNYTNINGNGGRTGNAGSFGFYEGFNTGRSLGWFKGWDMAWQFGLRAAQSDLSGTTFSGEARHQVFLTSGLFRRVDYGLQYGVAVDRLYDDWYYQANLTQIRAELSWKMLGPHTVGFQLMAGSGSDDSIITVFDRTGTTFNENVSFEPTDQYRLFYRQNIGHSGSWDAFLGWTDMDDALAGMNIDIPVARRLALNAGAVYLNHSENDPISGLEQEGWNIALGFTYRPGGFQACDRHNKPMFNVADNGTFLVDRL